MAMDEDERAAMGLRAFGQRIAKLRKDRGLSQFQLAYQANVSHTTLLRLEQGRAAPRIDTLIQILAPLDMTLALVPQKGGGFGHAV